MHKKRKKKSTDDNITKEKVFPSISKSLNASWLPKQVAKPKTKLSTKEKISQLVSESSNTLWLPKQDIEFENIKTNSWFDLKIHNNNDSNLPKPNTNLINEFKNEYHKSFTVE